MKVLASRLCGDDGAPVRMVRSPNEGAELKAPSFVVIHYTGGRSVEDTVHWLCSERAQASAHMVIGRAGDLVQLVEFDRIAWHAGRDSAYEGLQHMNAHSIGLELDNAGKLNRTAYGYATWFRRRVAGDDVVLAPHKHTPTVQAAWHDYTEEQLEAVYEVCRALFDHIPTLVDVIGHDDIAPGRKVDPGPAFPLEQLRARLHGRK